MSKEERFYRVMHAVEDELLEEAQMPVKKKGAKGETVLRWIVAVAACLCLVTVLALGLQRRGMGNDNITDESENAVTEEELLTYGYDMSALQDVKTVSYTLVVLDGEHETPMVQAEFTQDGVRYICRALKTEAPEDISGVTDGWTEELNWNAGNLNLQLNKAADDAAYVSWYTPENQTQWCLSAKEDSLSLMTTAKQIMLELGYDVAVAPAGAQDVTYNAFAMEDMTVAETTFVLDGVRYTYRMAGAVWSTDISGIADTFETEADGMIGWCEAKLYYTEGGAGKILWYDIVPGLMYSLSIDGGASEELLLQMADELYEPTQQEVG